MFFWTCALFLYGIITVATCGTIWGTETVPILNVLAGLILPLNGYVIYRKAMAMSHKNEKEGITND